MSSSIAKRIEMMTKLAQPEFSDDAVRQFLLGQLREEKRAAFEFSIFFNRSLEQRARLAEVALADEYVKGTLPAKERHAFVENFPVSAARVRQIEVSTALHERYAVISPSASRQTFASFAHPVWKLAFATMILIMLFATIWLATKEPRIVRRFIPHRISPAAATTPTPQVAHHATEASKPRTHREDSPAPPSHEAATNAIVLDSTTTAENAPVVTLATIHENDIRVQLILPETSQSTYRAELTSVAGEFVYSEEGLSVDAAANRVNFDIPIEHLTAGDFQIKLTRTSDGKQANYFLRLK
jgi:hypothetical protein